MKNKLLPLLFVLGGYSAYSQVVIGKQDITSPSAQLEVFSKDGNQGLLIPNVKLKSTTDTSTMKSGNVSSLLVFNTETVSDVVPGYYYWYAGRWNRFAISGEAAGIISGNGIPGKKGEPGYPGENVTLYTDKSTGTVYVQNEDGTWASINGKNGLDGKNGIAGGNGVPGAAGTPGIDGTIQMYVDYNTGIIYVRDPADKTKWVSINGKNGLDGKNGIAGGNGVPGAAGTPGIDGTIQMYVDYNTGIVYVRDPQDNSKWVPLNGKNGLDGKNGIAGGNGVPGAAGTPGIDGTIQMYVDYNTGIVYVRDPQDNSKWVPLNGKNGLDGKNGIAGGNGVPGAAGTPGIDGTIQMYVDYNTGIVYVRDPEDNTKWVPLNGKNGLDGKNGIAGGNGVPGAAGTPGIDGTIQMYVDYNTGIVYVRDPEDNTKWVPLNGKNGLDGKNGIAGGNGVPGAAGTPGIDGTIQMYVDYNTGIVYVRDPEDNTKWVPLNGKNGLDGKNGIAGGNGVPGAAGTPGIDGTIQMYVDYNTGIIYVRDPEDNTKWVSINGKNGLDGKNGIAGGNGVPGAAGTPGIDGTIQMYVDYNTGIVYVRDPEDNTKWVPLNGKNGLDGKNGIAGGNGVPGAAGTPGIDGTIQMYVDYNTGIVYVRDPEDNTKWVPLNGKNGLDGKNGIAGGNGVPGAAGTPGIDGTIQMYVDYNTGIVYVRDPEDNTKWVPLNGKNGLDGKNGIMGGNGVPGAAGTPGIDGTIQMYVDYNTGIVYVRDPEDNTKWVPLNGKNGLDGKNGIMGGNGVPGAAGTPGIDGTIQMYVDYNTGIVYVRDPEDNTKWVPLNGKNGLDGKNGIAGGNGVPGAAGTPGIDGTIQMYVDYNTGIVYVRDPEDNTKWVPLNGKNGLDGKNGIAGGNGAPGAAGSPGIDDTVQMYIDYTTGTVYVRDPNDPTKWVAANKETPTTLKYNQTSAVLTYTGEKETEIIPLKDISTETPDTVLKVTGGTAATFAATTVDIVPSEVKGDVLTTAEDGKVAWKAPAKANFLGIKVIGDDYTVTDDDYTIIAAKLKGNITINLPDATVNKGRMLVINQMVVAKADGTPTTAATPIVVNFNTNVIYSDSAEYPYITASVFGGVSKGSIKITLQSDGANWYVITYTM
ncbi:hypothetical protein [Flavobacterium sp. KACC 22761]|uniref:hypothetical protein n=1 Tax=Flavobacterium sp. KACC 22761 TaxID=3092665 RepID=UPI002A7570A3|nr:hypothetical protein [Flavobacterium sp. KACC 22761]WPO78479.1 hypothetical protein SCB73_19650 [Flavobacterium sp. KACC 22761]